MKVKASAAFHGASAMFAYALSPLELENANLRAENVALRERERLRAEADDADFDSVKNASEDTDTPRSTIERLMNVKKIASRLDVTSKHREPSKRDLRRYRAARR
jgi:hypothetical protein